MILKLVLIVVLIQLVAQIDANICSPVQVKLYENANYNYDDRSHPSKELTMKQGKCNDLKDLNDNLSSIEGDCIVLYDDYECKGPSIQLSKDEPCRKFLGDCDPNFNDVTSSLRLCPREECKASIGETVTACEWNTLDIKCPNGLINVVSANYGRLSETVCSNTGDAGTILSPNCVAKNSLDIVKAKCTDQRSCSVEATNAVFGDPCEQTRQYLEVEYESVISNFGDFKTIFEKNYTNETEEKLRTEIFKENLAFVNGHNDLFREGKKTFSLAINQFGDWTHEEYLKILGVDPFSNGALLIPESTEAPTEESSTTVDKRKKRATITTDCEADEKDWRKEGAVTPVKDQLSCASCWAFSATGALESHYFIKTKLLSNFSQQQFIDCSHNVGKGCNKGLMSEAFLYSMKNGLITDDKYPYKASENEEERSCNKFDSQLKITRFEEITTGNEDELMDAVCRYGPVSVAIDAASEEFKFYKKGVYRNPECSSDKTNHGVLLVGYGYDEYVEDEYWLIKNSYNISWGESGYARLPRRFHNHCGIASLASYPVF